MNYRKYINEKQYVQLNMRSAIFTNLRHPTFDALYYIIKCVW